MADTGPLLEQDATIWRGGSFRLRWPLTDDAGEPLNLTGATLYYRVAKHASSSTAILELSDAEIDRDGDVPVIPLTTARTLTIPAANWHHEIGWTDSAGERNPLGMGTLTSLHAQAAKLS